MVTLVKFNIDLENKEIQVIGNEQELEKISEEELKKYLSAFAFLNYEDDNLNTETVDKQILENERNMFVAKQIPEEKELKFYNGTTTMEMHSYDLIDTEIANGIMNSFTDIELEDDGLVKLWNTYFTKNKVDGKMRYVDMPNPDMIITSLCIEVTDIMYSNGIYTVTFTYCYPTTEDIDENRIEDLPNMELNSQDNNSLTYKVTCYPYEDSEEDRIYTVTFVEENGKYKVSKLESVENDNTSQTVPTEDEDLEKVEI